MKNIAIIGGDLSGVSCAYFLDKLSGVNSKKFNIDLIERDLEFANSYGMLLKELRLLARAVFVIDKKGQIVYKEVAKEIKSELNYDAALEVVMKAINE